MPNQPLVLRIANTRGFPGFTSTLRTLALMIVCAVLASRPALAFDLFSMGKTITPSGQIKTEQREVAGFVGIALGMPGEVEIKQGNTEGLVIETDENIIPLIRTIVENGTLQIRWENKGTRVDSRNHKIKITVNAINVNRLAAGGSGTLTAAQLQTTDLSVSIGGSGSIRLEAVHAKKLAVDIGGSGSFHAKGNVDSLSGAIGGSGGIRAGGLKTEDANLNMAGSGQATVWARKSLSVAIAGSGDVEYYGEPKISTSMAGSGSVRRLGTAPR